ncbi:uncharacterized protein ASCRUDRAFT_78952 [Ascoidea rubescens DSM 1968]|uniref:Uncharacterized protein n=1 Tax=Ascoidea rubescens DSM 1968 TaxID=1344418 RepID=A0A1D2VQU9_9ASCO|nr:hypothetical protein ASCRUDRAFT_78952 [Ascoidea rubescens DSM 1968]ODV63993.1 hypothetical protein ASCRUDRAFT_78952 [Ascoidea rubescens DSM 1968]
MRVDHILQLHMHQTAVPSLNPISANHSAFLRPELQLSSGSGAGSCTRTCDLHSIDPMGH